MADDCVASDTTLQHDWSRIDHEDPVFGDAGIASPEERSQLDDLRQRCALRLKAYQHDFPEVVGDVRLLRFLRGHKGVEVAAEYLNNHLKFREDHGIDSKRKKIVAEKLDFADFPGFDAVMKYMPFNHEFSYGRDGHSVSMQWNGRWDAVGLAQAVEEGEELTREGFIEFWRWACEYSSIAADRDSRQAGKMLGQIVLCDFRCVRLGQLSPGFISVVKDWVSELQDNYPEMNVFTAYCNTPTFFSVVWTFFSYLLSEGLKSKVQIFPEGSMQAHKVLLGKISSHNLSTEFGGIARPVQGYCENTDFVPPINRKRSSLRGHTGLGFNSVSSIERHYHPRINIPAGEFHELPIEMKSAEDVVSWEWTIDAHDVLFVVRFEPAVASIEEFLSSTSTEEVEKIVEKKVRPDQPEVGRFVAKAKGLLVLKFDNTHSRLRGKTIHYGRMSYDVAGATPQSSESEERYNLARLRIAQAGGEDGNDDGED